METLKEQLRWERKWSSLMAMATVLMVVTLWLLMPDRVETNRMYTTLIAFPWIGMVWVAAGTHVRLRELERDGRL